MNIICYKDIPLYEPNRFLNSKGLSSVNTRDSYGKLLVRFFNFFEDRYDIFDYRNIKLDKAMDSFMEDVIYNKVNTKEGVIKYLKQEETQITPSSAKQYMSRIQSFYLYLEKPVLDLLELDQDYIEKMLSTKLVKKIQQKTKYKGIWKTVNLSEISTLVPNTNWRNKRKSKITFTREEIDVLAYNLYDKGLRQLCIFLVCLECGTRIDEALSIKLKHFKENNKKIWVLGISKSKTKPRFVAVPAYLAKLINKYIDTERRHVTNNAKKYEYLFVSKKGKSKGNRISYSTFYTDLKESAKAGGLDPKHVVSHMARATKATQLKSEKKTNEQIKKALGNEQVIDPYIDNSNPDLITYNGEAFYYFEEA